MRQVEFVDFPVRRHRSILFTPRHQMCCLLEATSAVHAISQTNTGMLDF